MTIRAQFAGERATVFAPFPLPHWSKARSVCTAVWIAVGALLTVAQGGAAYAETPAATPLEPLERAIQAMPPREAEARQATFECFARATKVLFQQTAKARRDSPGLVHRRIADGFYAQALREACSATPRLELYDDDLVRSVIQGTAFNDWLTAENRRWNKETDKEDQWFDPQRKRRIEEYIDCMHRGARAIAIVSDEPAETVVKAARAACKPKADELRQTYREYGDALARINASVGLDGPGTVREYMAWAETLLTVKLDMHDELVLAIIQERARRRHEQEAQPPSPPSPEPKAHEIQL